MATQDNVVRTDVTQAEIERFKMERSAERNFVIKLQVIVRELESLVGPNNVVYRSMSRFLKRMV